jgi:hypothetical protein
MKVRVTLLGLSAVLLLNGYLSAGAKVPWTSYTSKKGGFSVSMPATPWENTKVVKTPYDTFEQTIVQVTNPRKGTVFAVTFTDIPADLLQGINPDDFLDEECQAFVRDGKGKLRYQKRITQAGVAGREIEDELLGGKAIARTRIFLVGRRLFHVTVAMPRDQASANDMNLFLDSFQFEQTR